MKHNLRQQGRGRKTERAGNNRKKKVLVVTSVASMVSQFLLPDIRLLQELGYEVHVMCNFQKGNTCDRMQLRKLEKELQEMHVTPHHWDCPRSAGRLLQCVHAFWRLWRLTGQQRFCMIHCHSPVGGVLARLAAHGRKIRVIYTAHGFHFYQGAPLKNWILYYPVEKLLSYWTDVLVTVNREDFQFAAGNLATGKICHIPGVGIDTSRFCQSKEENKQVRNGTESDWQRKEAQNGVVSDRQRDEAGFHRKYNIPPNAKVLLSVGELNRGKNHRVVIRALAELSGKDVYYLICGQGNLEKELRRYADRLGVAGRVRMPGYQQDMQRIYPYADIFVFPSMREGMPVALMEAMAAGLPCVVSDIRGNRELIANIRDGRELKANIRGSRELKANIRDSREPAARLAGSAADEACRRRGTDISLRFAPDDPKQLVRTLERLLADPQLRQVCGKRNQRKMPAYSREAVLRKMKQIYQAMEYETKIPGYEK